MAKSRKRKRIPGGGRKPKGPIANKRAAFATRITADTRQWLEAEARKRGWSLSQVAEWAITSQMHLAQQRRKVKGARRVVQ
jgi:hypothetical protein